MAGFLGCGWRLVKRVLYVIAFVAVCQMNDVHGAPCLPVKTWYNWQPPGMYQIFSQSSATSGVTWTRTVSCPYGLERSEFQTITNGVGCTPATIYTVASDWRFKTCTGSYRIFYQEAGATEVEGANGLDQYTLSALWVGMATNACATNACAPQVAVCAGLSGTWSNSPVCNWVYPKPCTNAFVELATNECTWAIGEGDTRWFQVVAGTLQYDVSTCLFSTGATFYATSPGPCFKFKLNSQNGSWWFDPPSTNYCNGMWIQSTDGTCWCYDLGSNATAACSNAQVAVGVMVQNPYQIVEPIRAPISNLWVVAQSNSVESVRQTSLLESNRLVLAAMLGEMTNDAAVISNALYGEFLTVSTNDWEVIHTNTFPYGVTNSLGVYEGGALGSNMTNFLSQLTSLSWSNEMFGDVQTLTFDCSDVFNKFGAQGAYTVVLDSSKYGSSALWVRRLSLWFVHVIVFISALHIVRSGVA